MRRILLALAVIVATPAMPCSITVREPVKWAFKEAPIVVQGTFEQIDAEGRAHFRVQKQWKGAATEIATLPVDFSSCGISRFDPGRSYLIIPDSVGTTSGSGYFVDAESGAALAKTLDARAAWWRSPLSSISPRRAIRKIAGLLDL